MKQVEATGKNVNAAIESGLEMLGLTLCDVDVEILQQKGLFRPAKVRLTVTGEGGAELESELVDKASASANREEKPLKAAPRAAKKEEKKPVRETKKHAPNDKPVEKEKTHVADKPVATEKAPDKRETGKSEKQIAPEQVELAVRYLEKLLSLMNVDAKLETNTDGGNINIELTTEDGRLIGHRGEVLEALSVLTKRAVEEGEDKYVRVYVDCNGYREKREHSLEALAGRMADKCVRTGRRVVLEPMNSNHRKVIHATLSDNDKVFTRSEGEEPNRRVVIMPKRKPQPKK